MLDLAVACGHGARKGKRLVWDVGAIQHGEAWLADRFANSTKNYWDVRDEAIRVADVVGGWAATIAQSRQSSVIRQNDIKLALDRLGPTGSPGMRILREDCPF
jgi:hypothetical protein